MLSTISINDYFDRPLADLAMAIANAPRHCVGDINLRELASTGAMPYGVYVFFDSASAGNCLYVGKVSSRSYAERIPMHFDPRAKSWMNQFAKKVSDQNCGGIYERGILEALDKYIMFVGFGYTDEGDANTARKNSINKLETVLRHFLKPRLNTPPRLKPIAASEILAGILVS